VVVVELDEFVGGLDVVVVLVFVLVVSLVFSFTTVEAGLTTVVLFSVFFSAGAAGVTVSVFCSHAPRSAALAKMQINFFISVGLVALLGTMPESARKNCSALPEE
jgi:fatty-acid desaturase